jgi:hypothetical protein
MEGPSSVAELASAFRPVRSGTSADGRMVGARHGALRESVDLAGCWFAAASPSPLQSLYCLGFRSRRASAGLLGRGPSTRARWGAAR